MCYSIEKKKVFHDEHHLSSSTKNAKIAAINKQSASKKSCPKDQEFPILSMQ